MKPIVEIDEKGRPTHTRLSAGDERWYDYDAGNLTHSRWSDGTERWYDADGNITKWKDKNGTLHTNGDEK